MEAACNSIIQLRLCLWPRLIKKFFYDLLLQFAVRVLRKTSCLTEGHSVEIAEICCHYLSFEWNMYLYIKAIEFHKIIFFWEEISCFPQCVAFTKHAIKRPNIFLIHLSEVYLIGLSFSNNDTYIRPALMHSVKICSHTFLLKIVLQQRRYLLKKLLKTWLHEIFFRRYLLKKLLKTWLHEIFSRWEWISHFSTLWKCKV